MSDVATLVQKRNQLDLQIALAGYWQRVGAQLRLVAQEKLNTDPEAAALAAEVADEMAALYEERASKMLTPAPCE